MIKSIAVERGVVTVEAAQGGLKEGDLKAAHQFALNIAIVMGWGKHGRYSEHPLDGPRDEETS